METKRRKGKDVLTSLQVMVPLGKDPGSVSLNELPSFLTITEPKEGKSLTVSMNATAMLEMLVSLIADLGQLTGRAVLTQEPPDVN